MTAPARRWAAFTAATVMTVTLSACTGDDSADFASPPPPATAGDQSQPTQDQVAATTAASDTAAAQTAEPVAPATEQTIEVNETLSVSEEDAAFTLTVHRVVVRDYYLEAEITVVNDGAEELPTWYGSGNGSTEPRIYDDQGRVYPFNVQAGGDGQSLKLEPGQGVDAVLVFAGRLDPSAQSVTLDFEELGSAWAEVIVEVPVGSGS